MSGYGESLLERFGFIVVEKYSPKLKPRWSLHLWGDEDELRCHGDALPLAHLEGSQTPRTDFLHTAYFTLVLVYGGIGRTSENS